MQKGNKTNMDMYLLSNKNLRENYEKAIKATTKEECDAFVGEEE